MTTLYSATVTGIGPDVPMIVEENMLIFFDEKAPKELHDVAVIHQSGNWTEAIRSGDTFVLGETAYPIMLVGETVNDTLRDLGHFTVNFTGDTSQPLPGSLYVQAESVPEITPGSNFRFIRV
ncbi:PTS sorbitol transporter subunit IIA [Paenibacillus darwinianus]|uniref:PTS sorbitol transporter subunit IIA n=1 Tax=Paenibacillus darwinianus TaxID=1380763 RepID=A0A9W5S3K9_9BACL|nr:PTS glucitol/sorbitol transporter subunit IIA [Paenibacillus darwinianus]EXX86923.1 PTS sorbitol transporter subunit IIA [Paenibacillus darwinianus]EXX90658.1 PTS sorbitol transporter subunit IIA [Paenibacillus darwinianus]EXX91628.1 PTS sorbitol transporter subunit IIA [Paenibacillus darwinianus]